ncbi:hypothetical protein GJ744_012020 [Endocarpon pusillum]|uniref:Heterokaryon incompatibility domain-containing protein n=1 Tax=Endocarpon pusillum TaxID=364733 RepID=A0A8H7ATZ5_9EURO|nr:hypothetical protein GJ744_012020 [Endocarpon pusillum]
MWLLNAITRDLEYFEGRNIPPYAILSHKWGTDEVTFQDVKQGRGQDKRGYQKVDYCCEQALQEKRCLYNSSERTRELGLSYVWVDTCCIDKSNSAELSEAINSMYHWYRRSAICYAYLSDVSGESFSELTASVWFTRGWTLQELVAPFNLRFYNCNWDAIGDKDALRRELSDFTGVPTGAMTLDTPSNYSIAERMSWAARRTTTRVEDAAYCLLGIFEINMPMIYGEGTRAFRRLQEEILRVSQDITVFAYSPKSIVGGSDSQLADSPAQFDHRNRDIQKLEIDLSEPGYENLHTSSVSPAGIAINLHLIPYFREVYLAPICFMYDENLLFSRLGMLIERLNFGNTYTRVMSVDQSMFEVSEELWDAREIRTVILRSGLLNRWQLNDIHDARPDKAYTTYGFEIWRINNETDDKNLPVELFSRSEPGKGYKHLLLPRGAFGIAGIVRFGSSTSKLKLFCFGFNFDFRPFCLVVQPEKFRIYGLHPSRMTISIPRFKMDDLSLASNHDMMKLVNAMWPSREDWNLKQDGIELHVMAWKVKDAVFGTTESDTVTYTDDGSASYTDNPWVKIGVKIQVGGRFRIKEERIRSSGRMEDWYNQPWTN